MKRCFAVLSATLLGIISISLCGCSTIPRPQKLYGKTFDVNGSGYVEQDELWNGLKEQSFVAIDANRDRQISREEWSVARPGNATMALFDTIDTDKNGFISYAEYSAYSDRHKQDLNRLLMDLDSNNDGRLSDAEIRAKPIGTIFKWTF